MQYFPLSQSRITASLISFGILTGRIDQFANEAIKFLVKLVK